MSRPERCRANSLVALHAARIMEGMLRRGFTSVRDAGGADHGLVVAQETGLIRGPRLFISGKACLRLWSVEPF
jgi:imidazolonepropionase-like amidohydrolase